MSNSPVDFSVDILLVTLSLKCVQHYCNPFSNANISLQVRNGLKQYISLCWKSCCGLY